MTKLVKENLEETSSKDVVSLLWEFWNQSRIKNRADKNFHDSEADFIEHCEAMKPEIEYINSCLKKCN